MPYKHTYHGLMICVVGIPNAKFVFVQMRKRERAEAADVGERSKKGTCAWGDIAFIYSPVVFSS